MNLRELRASHPGLFYRQEWFLSEPFMGRQAIPVPLPRDVYTTTDALASPQPLLSTATLCAAYVTSPQAICWKRYLWTSDADAAGQRVYIGDNGKGLEIHRHIHLTKRFGCPVW